MCPALAPTFAIARTNELELLAERASLAAPVSGMDTNGSKLALATPPPASLPLSHITTASPPLLALGQQHPLVDLHRASFAQFVVRRARFCPPPARLVNASSCALSPLVDDVVRSPSPQPLAPPETSSHTTSLSASASAQLPPPPAPPPPPPPPARSKPTSTSTRKVANGVATTSASARPYKCTVPGCTSLFGKANHLSRHIRIVHNKERPFRCDREGCSSRFGSRSHLVDHINAVHKRLRNFRCEKCNAAFSKSFNLAKHKRLMHTKAPKSHRCLHCDLSFGTRSHLTRHVTKVHRTPNSMDTTSASGSGSESTE